MEMQTIIKTLRLENFGRFENVAVPFDAGLNYLTGPNGSGKSTLVEALVTVLYTTAEEGALEKRRRRGASSGPRLSLVFTVGGKEFTLVRDYRHGLNALTDSDGIEYTGEHIEKKIGNYFGTASQVMFRTFFCSLPDGAYRPDTAGDGLRSTLEGPVFSGFDRAGADRYLQHEIDALEKPQADKPPVLDAISEQISARLQERSSQDERLTDLRADREKLLEVKVKFEEYDADVIRLEEDISGAEAYRQVNAHMDNLEGRLHAHLASYSRACQVVEDLERVEQELARVIVPSADELSACSDRRQELAEGVELAKQTMDGRIATRNRAGGGFALATLLLTVICLAYIIDLNGWYSLGELATYLPYAVPVLAVFWVIRLIGYIAQGVGKSRATADFRQRVAQLDDFYAEINDRYNIKSADPIAALEEMQHRRQVLEFSAANLQGTISHLSEEKGLEYLTQIKEQLESEVAILNKELDPLTRFATEVGKLPDMKEEITAKRVRANALREQAALLSERCSVIEALENNIDVVDEEIEKLKARHRDVSQRLEVLKITRLALNRAADTLVEDTLDAYSEEATAFARELLDAPDLRLRLAKDPTRFEYRRGEAESWQGIAEGVSHATRDCLHTALRLAAADVMSKEFRGPVLFEQADIHLDDDRRSRFVGTIARVAQSRQVISVGLPSTAAVENGHTIDCAELVPVEAATI